MKTKDFVKTLNPETITDSDQFIAAVKPYLDDYREQNKKSSTVHTEVRDKLNSIIDHMAPKLSWLRDYEDNIVEEFFPGNRDRRLLEVARQRQEVRRNFSETAAGRKLGEMIESAAGKVLDRRIEEYAKKTINDFVSNKEVVDGLDLIDVVGKALINFWMMFLYHQYERRHFFERMGGMDAEVKAQAFMLFSLTAGVENDKLRETIYIINPSFIMEAVRRLEMGCGFKFPLYYTKHDNSDPSSDTDPGNIEQIYEEWKRALSEQGPVPSES